VAGVILGVAIAVKPLPLVILPFFLVRGFWKGDRPSRHMAVAAILTMLPLVTLLPFSGEYFLLADAIITGQSMAGSNGSWAAYVSRVFGLGAPASAVSVLVLGGLGSAGLALLRIEDERRAWAVLLALCLFSTPVVWGHSYFALSLLPLLVVVRVHVAGGLFPHLPARLASCLGWAFIALMVSAMLNMKYYFAGGNFVGEFVAPLIPRLCPLACAWMLLRTGWRRRP
jgi:hypothetical protein